MTRKYDSTQIYANGLTRKEYMKQWRKFNRERNREKVRQQEKQYRDSHKDVIKNCRDKWSTEHPDWKKQYQKRATQNHKEKWMIIIKEIFGELCCSKCNYNTYFQALDFHHVDPLNKEYSISNMLRWKVTQSRIDELKKCILLCCRCHRELHIKEGW